MARASSAHRIGIDDFERFHRARVRLAIPPVSFREVATTLVIACVVCPFMFTAFFVIPIMGQFTVGLAAFITALYLLFRKSFVIALTVALSCVALSSIAFMSIQSIKYRLDVTMFVLIALGIPVTFIYSVFVGMKIWELRGGAE